jgi:RHS repeat-associated protein
VKKYYYAGGTRVAMSDNGTIRYFVTDHLGSTTRLINVDGSEYSDMSYLAWGSDRLTPPGIGTSFKYTGQRQAEVGLYYYNARWYDPQLGRFIQADTIIPSPGNPLAWDRYGYANNNPIVYADPSGHMPCENSTSGCKNTNTLKREKRSMSGMQLGIEFVGDWTQKERNYVLQAATLVANNLSSILGMNPSDAFKSVYGVDSEHPFIFIQDSCEMCKGSGAFTAGARLVDIDYEYGFAKVIGNRTISIVDSYNVNTMVHELGHAFNQRNSFQPASSVETYKNGILLNGDGYASGPTYLSSMWTPNRDTSPSESFANMFLGWNYDTWRNNEMGRMRDNFMTTNMVLWVNGMGK